MKKNLKKFFSVCLSVVILISTLGNFNVIADETTDKQSVLDRCSLQMANNSKESYLAAIESFEQLAEENIDVVTEITNRTNIAKFCGESFTNVTLSLVNPEQWFDVAKDGAKYAFLNALTIATINYGIEYCEQGAMYFEKMQAIYDKYNGGEVTDPDDARDIIKYRFYAARCYLYGFEFMMPFIEGYLESGGVSGILIESMGEEALDSLISGVMKEVYDTELIEKLWSGIMDGSGNIQDLLDTLIFSITEDKQLVFDDIDAMIAKLEGAPPADDEEIDFSEETDSEYDGELIDLIDKTIYQSLNPYYTEWNEDIVLTKDTVISNLKITGGSVNLNGYELTVLGNLIQSSGTVHCNKGTLHVTGDYRILTESTDEFGDKQYTPSTGCLYMEYEEDEVDVDGGFYTCNSRHGYAREIAVYGRAGTMRVGGTFEILDYNDLDIGGTHKVILDGDEKQTITMSGTKFNILQLTKDFDEGYEFEYEPCWSEIIYCDSEPEDPTTEEPSTEEVTTEEVTTEETTTEELTTEYLTTEPATKEPVTHIPTTEKSTEIPTEKPTQKPVSDKLEVSGDTVEIDNSSKISTVKIKSTVTDIIKAVKNEKVSVVDKNGNAISGDALVGTGSKIQIKDNSGKVINEYTVCVPNDVDGNGKTTAADARLALRGSAKLENIDGVYATASDVDGNGKITAADARKILRVSAGLEKP